MIFSILILSIILSFVLWLRKIKKRMYYLSFLETGTPNYDSFRSSIKSKKRYFIHKDGIVDLSKHPELARFKEINGYKEYLVEPWKRTENFFIEEGVSKVVIFEYLEDPINNENLLAIPCLRRVETLIEQEIEDPLLGYKETYLGISWGDNRKIVKSDTLFGIVRYESI